LFSKIFFYAIRQNKKIRPMTKLKKPKSSEIRDREYLTPSEIDRMVKATYQRWRRPRRDALLILMMFRHGLRVSEATRLTWDRVYLDKKKMKVERINGGRTTVHPLGEDEISELSQLQRWSSGPAWRDYIFPSERGGPLSPSSVRAIVVTAGKAAGIPFLVSSHMLRHSCGYYLAQKTGNLALVQKYLGHKSPQHVMRYAAPVEKGDFEGLWEDE
jgi:integrase